MLLCAICTGSYGGSQTLEIENGKHPCSICTKLFQRYRIYQPERWSISLPTAMCHDCATARQCCQVCYCDVSTLMINRVYSNAIPPGGSFLQADVNADTLQKRYEGPFLQHMQSFTPVFICKMTLMDLRSANEGLVKEVCSNLCIMKFLIDQRVPNNTTENHIDHIAIHLTIRLSSEQQNTFFLDIPSTCARIRAYMDQISGMFEDMQRIVAVQRFRLASTFGTFTDFAHELPELEKLATAGTQCKADLQCEHTKDVQMTKIKVIAVEHNSFSLTLMVKSAFPAELMCLLKAYTEVDAILEISVDNINGKITLDSQIPQ